MGLHGRTGFRWKEAHCLHYNGMDTGAHWFAHVLAEEGGCPWVASSFSLKYETSHLLQLGGDRCQEGNNMNMQNV